MKDKDMFRFRVSPLASGIFFSWSQDIQAILRGKGPQKYIGSRSGKTSSTGLSPDEIDLAAKDMLEEFKEREVQKRSLE